MWCCAFLLCNTTTIYGYMFHFNINNIFQFSFICVDLIKTAKKKQTQVNCEGNASQTDNERMWNIRRMKWKGKIIRHTDARTRTHKHAYAHTNVTCRRIINTKCLDYLLIFDLFYLCVNINMENKCAHSITENSSEARSKSDWLIERVLKREINLCIYRFVCPSSMWMSHRYDY